MAIGYPFYKGSPCVTTEIMTDKFDVLRGRLLGNHNDLCILWLELLCSCRVGGWSGHLTVNGSRYNFPGVDHEERQTCRWPITFTNLVFQFNLLVKVLFQLQFKHRICPLLQVLINLLNAHGSLNPTMTNL